MPAHVLGIVRSATVLRELVYEGGAVALRPYARALTRHWNALAAAHPWDAREHVAAIVAATVPACESVRDLPALPERPVSWRPTAAHPRAYRGTKDRPPKPRRVGPIDLRPYLFGKHLERLGVRDATHGLDPWSAMYVWPLGAAFVPLARALDLAANPALYAALVGIHVAAEDPAGWWSHVLAHAPEQRLDVARLLLESGVVKRPVIETSFAELPEAPRMRVYRALANGATRAYIASGIALDALTDAEVPAGTRDVTDVVAATLPRFEHLKSAWLWRLCGAHPEVIDVLASPAFAALSDPAARWIVELADSPRWDAETAERDARELAPALPGIVALAARVPRDYQQQFVEHVARVVWWASDQDEPLAASLGRCIALCARVARPPFSTVARLGYVIPPLGWHGPRTILDAPDASWLALEAACRRINQAKILWLGLNRMARFVPELVARTFARAPTALLETADVVAALSFEAAKRVLRSYAATPLATLGDAPLDELVAAIDPIVRSGGPNPVRRELRRYLAGERMLTPAQVDGHRARIVRDLDLVRLAAIRQAVDRALAARVGAERITATQRHAVALINKVEKQRRQLRRLIAAYVAGDRDWHRRHPESVAWLARHPALRRDVWFGGHELVEGGVRIANEPDPLEALQLGTHVGSCLGRGGGLVYSAAATVLDVNKQVIYARDARGTVIGRQVVAISESDELVCFHIYGPQREALEPLFRRYDRELAERLGTPLRGEPGYEIAMILSHEWWDDYPWFPE